MIRRFAHEGRSNEDWDSRFGVPGDIGDVTAADHPDYLRVRWPNGDDPSWASYVDRDCVELFEGPTTREYMVGDRVRLIAPYSYRNRHQEVWTTTYGGVGTEGVVARIGDGSLGNELSVHWEGSGTRNARGPAWVDRHCIELVSTPSSAEAEAERQRLREERVRAHVRAAAEEYERQIRNMEQTTRRATIRFDYSLPSYTSRWIDDDLDWWEE